MSSRASRRSTNWSARGRSSSGIIGSVVLPVQTNSVLNRLNHAAEVAIAGEAATKFKPSIRGNAIRGRKFITPIDGRNKCMAGGRG